MLPSLIPSAERMTELLQKLQPALKKTMQKSIRNTKISLQDFRVKMKAATTSSTRNLKVTLQTLHRDIQKPLKPQQQHHQVGNIACICLVIRKDVDKIPDEGSVLHVRGAERPVVKGELYR